MTRKEIIRKKFSKALLGYDMLEVDRFLDELADEITRLNKELDGQGSAQKEPAQEKPEETIGDPPEKKPVYEGKWDTLLPEPQQQAEVCCSDGIAADE